MGWMPGATIMRGRNAGYRVGRVKKESAVCHYTVGRNSAGIGVNGYFQFLIRRNGEIVQFAESDAVCWHAGDWNGRGVGIEIEYHEGYDGPHPQNIFTSAALASCGRLVRWLTEEDGYPKDFHHGARVRSHRGYITHGSLIQSGDWHYDYWSHDHWKQMVGAPAPSPAPKPKRGSSAMRLIINVHGRKNWEGKQQAVAFIGDDPTKPWSLFELSAGEALDAHGNRFVPAVWVTPEEFDNFKRGGPLRSFPI